MPFDELRPNQFQLTPRERECARWIGLAASNAEIARQMTLKVSSVENILNRIFRKQSAVDDPRRNARVRLARWAWLNPGSWNIGRKR